MSKVSIQGNSLGTGTLTIAAPNTSSNYTLTLPDLTGTISLATYTVQVFTTGSGTYTTPTGCKAIRVRMVGGGGGGGGGNSGGAGGAGGNTTFGSSLLTCNGGGGGTSTANGGGSTGGSATLNSPATGLALTGSPGSAGAGYANPAISNLYLNGGAGGGTPFGSGGCAQGSTSSGSDAIANTGAGGGGSSSANNIGANNTPGGGGAAGAYIEAYISSPSATYSYAVGAGGTAGTAGTGTGAGGSGGRGVIIVQEYY